MSTDKHPLDQQLLRASAKGRLHDVINLLQKGATLAVNKHGRTPLHIAAHRGYLDIVRTLLQAGCNPDIQDDNGDTALHRAVTAGYERIVQRLLDEACSVDRQNNLGDTALHEASRCGYSRIVKCLIQASANVSCRNKNGDVPLHMACANGHATSTQQLLSASSNPSASNKQGDMPLHLAVRFAHCTCTRLLIGSNCDINHQNEFGNTALHIAVVTQHRKIVRILLDGKAEAQKILNKKRKSPVDLARDNENGELILMLVSGSRPPSHRRRGRSQHKTSSAKYRSRSDPRDARRQENNSSEECNANTSLRRMPRKKKIKDRNYTPGPELCRNLYRVSRRKLENPSPKKGLDDYHRKLVVNPYIVPQLYTLHRDQNGSIHQTPVVTDIPTPPQVVTHFDNAIQRTRQDLTSSMEQAATSLSKRIDELKTETEYQLKSLDRITSERIRAERTMCLHRIDQRAMHERTHSQRDVMDKLQGWMESRLGQRKDNTYSYDVKPTDIIYPPRSNHHDGLYSHNDTYSPDHCAGKLHSTQPAHFHHHNLMTESEVRSVDSGVGETSGIKNLDSLTMKFPGDLTDHTELASRLHEPCNIQAKSGIHANDLAEGLQKTIQLLPFADNKQCNSVVSSSASLDFHPHNFDHHKIDTSLSHKDIKEQTDICNKTPLTSHMLHAHPVSFSFSKPHAQPHLLQHSTIVHSSTKDWQRSDTEDSDLADQISSIRL
ncbi:uncharacterized protein LOC143462461 [Clavelina lepadiformis]|uniref:uncharacterized protein LOC143462461 n=1 Tax=Clavelina lepadiformis TaxID=159417 RepID=UPI0040430F76